MEIKIQKYFSKNMRKINCSKMKTKTLKWAGESEKTFG